MNAFSGMIGDYGAIMGNTGGDNRVEFGTRLDHAIWYESPNMGGLAISALISPGQNRAYDDSNLASGEADCTGGNIPGSGGLPVACNDGSFGSAYSISAGFTTGGLYVTSAYELHRAVNRTSDLPTWDPRDVANEWAAKIGAQYRLPTGTTVSAIFEKMDREVPSALAYQNERSRTGYWLAASQSIDATDSLHVGWAHANQAQGDPGQLQLHAGRRRFGQRREHVHVGMEAPGRHQPELLLRHGGDGEPFVRALRPRRRRARGDHRLP